MVYGIVSPLESAVNEFTMTRHISVENFSSDAFIYSIAEELWSKAQKNVFKLLGT
jgi:hypothetical protein